MDIISYEIILSNLPIALAVWTTLTLSWGVWTAIAYGRMMKFADKYKGGRRPTDVAHHKVLVLANIILATYLAYELTSADIVFADDAIVVWNVFYSGFLIPSTISIVRWFKAKPKPSTPTIPEQHLLT